MVKVRRVVSAPLLAFVQAPMEYLSCPVKQYSLFGQSSLLLAALIHVLKVTVISMFL